MAHEKDGARSLPSVLQRLKHSSDVKGKLHPSEAAATGLSFRGEPHLAENVRRQKGKKNTAGKNHRGVCGIGTDHRA